MTTASSTTCEPISFNSEMVRLKDLFFQVLDRQDICFNSEMVRLKAKAAFQSFFKGSRFNSEMVRLKENFGHLPLPEVRVSIPKWFD